MATTARERVKQRKKYLLLIILLLAIIGALLFFYYLLTSPPRLLNSPRTDGYASQFSIYGFGADRLLKPTEVAVDTKGDIYVADTYNHRVVVFDSQGRFIATFGKRGQGRHEIEFPSGVAVAPNGNIYVLSRSLNKVVIYDSKRVPFWEIFAESPQAAAIKDGKFYLATYRGIMVGDLKGNLLTNFGRWGRNAGGVDRPGGIAVDSKGNIYVADSMNYRLQAFSPSGKSLWTVGAAPKKGEVLKNRNRRFGLPVGLAIDKDDLLYLVDAFKGTINIFDTKGKELKRVGEWGNDEGQFYYPGGIAYAGNETFAVADKYNDRVQVIRIPSPVAPAYARVLDLPLPWLLPLAFLPLLFWPRRKFVSDEAFLQRILEEEQLVALADAVPRIEVTEGTIEALTSAETVGLRLEQDDVRLLDILKPLKTDVSKAQEFQEKYELNLENAELLARALKGRRTVVFTEDEYLREILDKKRPTYNFELFMELYWGRRYREEGSSPPPGAPIPDGTPGIV